MPAVSAKQKRLMDAAAHNPAFAKKVGVPSKVAKEFSAASKGETFSKGADMKTSKPAAKKPAAFKTGGSVKPTAMGKVVAGGNKGKGQHTVQKKGLTKGKQVKM